MEEYCEVSCIAVKSVMIATVPNVIKHFLKLIL